MADCCGNCRFWNALGLHSGQCHRLPPHPHYGWPETGSAQWCGEHQPTQTETSRADQSESDRIAAARVRALRGFDAAAQTVAPTKDPELVWSKQPPTQPGVYRRRVQGSAGDGLLTDVRSNGRFLFADVDPPYSVEKSCHEWSQRLAPVNATKAEAAK